MAFDRFTKAKNCFRFWVWYLLVDVSWASTWSWATQPDDNQRDTHLLGLNFIQKHTNNQELNAIQIIVVPAKLTIGWETSRSIKQRRVGKCKRRGKAPRVKRVQQRKARVA